MTGRPLPNEEDGDGRIGIFPGWRALYVTVLVYTVILVIALHAFSVAFDHRTS